DAAARHRSHETFALELRHCLAHRRTADAEVLREFAFVQPDVVAAAIDIHRHDRVFQGRVRLVFETRRNIDWLQRGARRERGPGIETMNGTGFRISATHTWYTISQMRRRAATAAFPALSGGWEP